jgi:hypothetical protein
MEAKQVKRIADTEAKKEVKAHEKKMHGKGYAKGGVTSESMKKYGRNVARMMNQRSNSARGR